MVKNNGDQKKNKSLDTELSHELGNTVERKTRRMQAHRNTRTRSPWFGLGFFGLIGWSIAIPTLVGVWLGSMLDARFTGPPSWTLTCLLLGLILGCVNAAFWIKAENTQQANNHNEH